MGIELNVIFVIVFAWPFIPVLIEDEDASKVNADYEAAYALSDKAIDRDQVDGQDK